MIVGRFLGTSALAAVGATSSIVSLLVGFFVGLASGASVVIAQYYGARDRERLSASVHTAVILALVSGLFFYDSWHRHRTDNSQDYADTPGHYGRCYGIYSGVLYGYDPADAL